jgi:signal transduction histidine kinase
MPVSKRFLDLLHYQLAQFSDRSDLIAVVVYVTEPGTGDTPELIPVGQWPAAGRALPPSQNSALPRPSERQRWLPLRHRGVLLGALQVESHQTPWPEPLGQRLQAVALCLTEALCLDLDHRQLQGRLERQQHELDVLLHQLRNPLAALRTFGQLLLRRLDQDARNRPLVEGLLREEGQLQRYVEAIDGLGQAEPSLAPAEGALPLLLPTTLEHGGDQPLQPMLQLLVQRAAATANLQSRPWSPPDQLPDWRGQSDAVAEILANLLENAFRYSPAGAPVGLHVATTIDGGWDLGVWDGGAPIPSPERQQIFIAGERGSHSSEQPGSGLGLALARRLAERLGGTLVLTDSPQALDPGLPRQGNAFRLRLPPSTAPSP